MQSRPLDTTEADILSVVKKKEQQQKCIFGQSCMITNEMIKASLPMILPVYHKLVNTILSLGTVPNIYCNGIITPMFKSGARSDSSNYRGICVSSCFNFKPKTTWTCRSA